MDATVPPPWAGEKFGYLTTTGRRSGRHHEVEIWFAVHDHRLYLTDPTPRPEPASQADAAPELLLCR